MVRIILFWLKYKRVTIMPVEQYNEGMKHAGMLNLNDLMVYLAGEELEDSKKIKSLFKQVGEYEILTHIASCAIKPRFWKWKEKKRLKYCKDINRSVNLALSLSGFFLSNFGLKQKNLGNFLKVLSQS
mgnify:CR=1 FL=1